MIPQEAIELAPERDDLITPFGRLTLADRYQLENEPTPQHLFRRVAAAYADDVFHGRRLYDYLSLGWYMPGTPTLSNGGTTRGLPISCYLNSVEDDMESISSTWNENVALGANGGGIGTDWSDVRSVGERIANRGKTSGVIPFLKVMDSQALAVSQGSLRRGASAVYLSVSHPEIEEFVELRKPNGDLNRRSLNIHHGVVIPDAFMCAVRDDGPWDLCSPKTGEVLKTVGARDLYAKILETRLQTGEPYLLFIDTVNELASPVYKALGLNVKQSNLCSEITLATGRDYLGEIRTAVCCLGSINLARWDEYESKLDDFVTDVMRMEDNVLTSFIEQAVVIPGFRNAAYSAARERAIGIGVMGLHTYYQSRGWPFESLAASQFNAHCMGLIHDATQRGNIILAHERGPCPDAYDAGLDMRFSHVTAIAPTATISIICGEVSPGVEPIATNYYTHKTLSGSIPVRNRQLTALLERHGLNTPEVWSTILHDGGSVQNLKGLPLEDREVFRTAFEVDQRAVVEQAVSRAPYVDQGQSINIFLPSDVHKYDLHMLHYKAWQGGIKSLYYLRSQSVQRAGLPGSVSDDNTLTPRTFTVTDYEECLACQ